MKKDKTSVKLEKSGLGYRLRWKSSISAHFITNNHGQLCVVPVGCDLCFNLELADEGHLTMVLPFNSPADLQVLRDFIDAKLSELETPT